MTVEFEHANTRIEVTRWYRITGAPVVKTRSGTSILPSAAHFVFVDGDFSTLVVNGFIVKKDGTVSDRVVKVPTIWSWNQDEWPDWLRDLRNKAFVDFALDQVKVAA